MEFENYCIDDIALRGCIDSPSILNEMKGFITLIEATLESSDVLAPDTIDYVPLAKGVALWEIYSANFSESDFQFGIDRDTSLRLQMVRRQFQCHAKKPIEVAIDDTSDNRLIEHIESGSAAIIFDTNFEKKFFSLLSLKHHSLLPKEYQLVTKDEKIRNVFYVNDRIDREKYVRRLITKLQLSEKDFFEAWKFAFPNLICSDNLSFNRFRGGFSANVGDVINHLSFLNDTLLMLLKECDGNLVESARRARAQHNIDFSNESVKTRSSDKLMKQRIAQFLGKNVTCETHTKLSPNENRIHFSLPPNQAFTGKILIGIFVDHLPT